MWHTLQVTFPFFALVLAGYAAARSGQLPLAAIPGMNGFVLYFALPCLLFRWVADTPLARVFDPALAAVYTACGLTLLLGAIALTRRLTRLGWNDTTFGALVAVFPNSGFMGVPLLTALLGQAAAGPVILTLLIDMVLTTSLCVALSRRGMSAPGHARATPPALAALRQSLRGVAVNPMPWAIALGAVFSWARWQLPSPLTRTVGLLADAASPVALFTIGAVLARSRRVAPTTLTSPASGGWRDEGQLVAIKLLLQPALLWLAGSAAMHTGLPLTPFALHAAVLVAALPSASNVSLLAERFGADTARVARIILWSTVLAFGSFAAAVQWTSWAFTQPP